MNQDIVKNKKVIVRADGNARIGAGHLMRCLTIADALPDKEAVIFLCADEESAEVVIERGYAVKVLYSDYRQMSEELPVWKEFFGDSKEAVCKRTILVDSYFVSNAYLSELHQYGRIVLLDDMAQEARPADIIVNYNVFATDALYKRLYDEFQTKYYTGGRYIPVRNEFCKEDYILKEKVEEILITTGGGDCENIAGQILDRIWTEDCRYHVVTGRYNPYYEKLRTISEEKSNIHVYHDVKDMAGLMCRCDLAVTAGGTTIYELSAIGVPFVCFSYAQNQELLTEYIGEKGIAGYGGAFHKDSPGTIEEIGVRIEELRNDFELRERYSVAEQKLVDGKGAARIAEIIWRSV